MRKNIIRITLVAAAIAGAFIALGSWKSAPASSPCEESMDQCCQKKSKSCSEPLIWETLSGQFSTSSGRN